MKLKYLTLVLVALPLVACQGEKPITHKLVISETEVTIEQYSTTQLTVTYDGQDVTEEAVWTTTNDKVATVDKGYIVTNEIGDCSIDVSYLNLQQACLFKVSQTTFIPKIVLSDDEIIINKGASIDIEALISFKGATYKNLELSINVHEEFPSDVATATINNGIITITGSKAGETVFVVGATAFGSFVTSSIAVIVNGD